MNTSRGLYPVCIKSKKEQHLNNLLEVKVKVAQCVRESETHWLGEGVVKCFIPYPEKCSCELLACDLLLR